VKLNIGISLSLKIFWDCLKVYNNRFESLGRAVLFFKESPSKKGGDLSEG
jgi:hypothetical protein